MENFISGMVNDVIRKIISTQEDKYMFDLSGMSQELLVDMDENYKNSPVPFEKIRTKTNEATDVSNKSTQEFTAADIFPEYVQERKICVESFTQTSQPKMMSDAMAQTSQNHLADIEPQLVLPVEENLPVVELLPSHLSGEEFQGDFDQLDDQEVPRSVSYPPIAKLKIRRIGLSKRAKMGSLHCKK